MLASLGTLSFYFSSLGFDRPLYIYIYIHTTNSVLGHRDALLTRVYVLCCKNLDWKKVLPGPLGNTPEFDP